MRGNLGEMLNIGQIKKVLGSKESKWTVATATAGERCDHSRVACQIVCYDVKHCQCLGSDSIVSDDSDMDVIVMT